MSWQPYNGCSDSQFRLVARQLQRVTWYEIALGDSGVDSFFVSVAVVVVVAIAVV